MGMRIISIISLGVMAILMSWVVFGTFYHVDKKTILDGDSVQACCLNVFASASTSNLPIRSATGNIVSLQNDEGGKPTWITYGRWNMTSSIPAENNQTNSTGVAFDVNFNMYNIDGSGKDKYDISDFVLTDNSKNEKSTILNGTATITTSEASFDDVPISIKIMDPKPKDQTISLWIDPNKVNDRFGNTPIYGFVKELQN